MQNMRLLAQPRVLNRAVIAGLATALASYPRISLWLNPSAPIWYLEAMIFLCSIVLWGFVFAWHEPYTQRPVWRFKLEPKLFITATVIGIIAAVVFHFFLDPPLRVQVPKEYPADSENWLAQVLFSLFLTQNSAYLTLQKLLCPVTGQSPWLSLKTSSTRMKVF